MYNVQAPIPSRRQPYGLNDKARKISIGITESSYHHSTSLSLPQIRALRQVSAHIVPDTRIGKETLDLPNSRDGHIPIPKSPLREVHDVLLRDLADHSLDFLGRQPPACGNDLTADVLRNGGGAVERKQDGGLELGLGTLSLGLADIEAETRPLTESEVDKIVDAGEGVSDEVDTPETGVGVGGARRT